MAVPCSPHNQTGGLLHDTSDEGVTKKQEGSMQHHTVKQIEGLHKAEHWDPHDILGPHPTSVDGKPAI